MGSKVGSQDSSLSYCLGFALIAFYFSHSSFKRGEKRGGKKGGESREKRGGSL